MNKYKDRIKRINSKENALKQTFVIGFAILEKLRVSEAGSDVIFFSKYAKMLYPPKKAREVTYNTAAACISYLIVFFVLTAVLSIAIKDTVFTGCITALTLYAAASPVQRLKSAADKRYSEIMHDYIQVLMKFSLLINTGMILTEVFSVVSKEGKGELYRRMYEAQRKMNNGMSFSDAVCELSDECSVKPVKNFLALLLQSSRNGSEDLSSNLNNLVDETLQNRQNEAERKGEAASQKLLFPIIIMFVGIVLMITVPVFISMI